MAQRGTRRRERQIRPDSELVEVSKHLFYAIEMLFATADRLHTRQAGETSDQITSPVHNALLESFAMHARVLLDFLYGAARPHPLDVYARHFFDDPEIWIKRLPPKSDLLKSVHHHVRVRVAHLSYARSRIHESWDTIRIAEQVGQILGQFVALAPEERLRRFQIRPRNRQGAPQHGNSSGRSRCSVFPAGLPQIPGSCPT